jgi:hypothetical protein
MGNNQEIRKRMETYRSILLVLNWIVAVVLIIVGFVLTNSRYTQGIGIGVIIGSVVIGVIGHFLVNVALAIPFILLNNGDYLAAIIPEGKTINNAVGSEKKISGFGNNTDIPMSSIENYTSIPSPGQLGDEYQVVADTALRSGPEEDAFVKKVIRVGDKVCFQNVLTDKPNWFYIKTLDKKNEGWCFAGHLKRV